jgi:cellulose biosynthesis protein BcsQ/tetratricopeptide (TPR) repeat protein
MKAGNGVGARQQGVAQVVVFYSHSGGAGGSGTLANLAVLLANAGHRILVVDLDANAPSQHRYLGPFLPSAAAGGASLAAPVRLDCEFAHPDGVIDFAGPMNADDTSRIEAVQVRREDLRTRDYDYVLIDSPGGVSPAVDHVTAELSDTLVVGCPPAERSVIGASVQVRRVVEAGREPRLVPVPMRVDRRALVRTDRVLALLYRTFDAYLDTMTPDERFAYWREVAIPYVPEYAFDECVVSMEARTTHSDTLLAAYARLAAEIFGVSAAQLLRTPVPDAARDRYLAGRRALLTAGPDVAVIYAPTDRIWGEWIASELSAVGAVGELLALDAGTERQLDRFGTAVLVMSRTLAGSPRLAPMVDALSGRERRHELSALVVRTDAAHDDPEGLGTTPFPFAPAIGLQGLDAAGARRSLLGFFSAHPPDSAARDEPGTHFPGDELRQKTNLPVASGPFLGRDQELEQMRSHFAGHVRSGAVCLLTGEPGVGKTRTAAEYAARFAPCYDVVWIIPSRTRESAIQSLLELAGAMGQKRRDGFAGVVSTLSTWESRALLIYDGLEDAQALRDLVPPTGAHVVITARHALRLEAHHVALDRLRPEESTLLARTLVPAASDPEAAAELLAHHPQCLVLAAAWIASFRTKAADECLEELAESIIPAASEQRPADTAIRIGILARLLVQRLAASPWSAAAQRLLETCLLLSPDGVSPRLLQTGAFIADLEDVEPTLSDPVVLDNVLAALEFHGLLGPGPAVRRVFQIPAAVRDALREDLSPQRCDQIEERVVKLLARCVPPAVEESMVGDGSAYADLQRHVGALRVERYPEPSVRRWLVNQVRYLYVREDTASWQAGLALATRLEDSWTATLPSPDTDVLLAVLLVQKANIHRSRNEFARALELDETALHRLRNILGLAHPRTLMCARSYAADLRHAGRYEDAVLEEATTCRGFEETVGPRHALSVLSSHNFSTSLLLAGDAGPALDHGLEVLDRAPSLLAQEPDLRGYGLTYTGIYYRELGAYETALTHLSDAERFWQHRVDQGLTPAGASVVIDTAVNLAAVWRRMPSADSDAAPDRWWKEPLERAESAYEPGHACVLLCRANKAAQLHAEGRHEEAAKEARECHEGYCTLLGSSHPYAGICLVNAGAYLSSDGHLEEAESISYQGWRILARALGARHVWLAIAGLSHAAILADRAGTARALAASAPAAAVLRSQLGSAHPVTRQAERFRETLARPAHARDLKRSAPCPHSFEIDLPFT